MLYCKSSKVQDHPKILKDFSSRTPMALVPTQFGDFTLLFKSLKKRSRAKLTTTHAPLIKCYIHYLILAMYTMIGTLTLLLSKFFNI